MGTTKALSMSRLHRYHGAFSELMGRCFFRIGRFLFFKCLLTLKVNHFNERFSKRIERNQQKCHPWTCSVTGSRRRKMKGGQSSLNSRVFNLKLIHQRVRQAYIIEMTSSPKTIPPHPEWQSCFQATFSKLRRVLNQLRFPMIIYTKQTYLFQVMHKSMNQVVLADGKQANNGTTSRLHHSLLLIKLNTSLLFWLTTFQLTQR